MSELLPGRHVAYAVLKEQRRKAIKLYARNRVEPELEALCKSRRVPVEVMNPKAFDQKMVGLRRVSVVLEAAPYPYLELADLTPTPGKVTLVLDHLEDPRNLGAILRTAGAVGVDGVVLPKQRSALLTPVAQQAAVGVAESLKVAKVPNLARALADLKQQGAWVYGLDMDGESLKDWKVTTQEPIVLVVGAEGKGLHRLVREGCDGLVRLPMKAEVESLNASVATALALYRMSGLI